MNQKHRGALSELRATAWLLEQGYEVFSNVSQHGPVDLIARDTSTGELIQIDVTTGSHYVRKDGTTLASFAKTKLNQPGIRVLIVFPNNSIVWGN